MNTNSNVQSVVNIVADSASSSTLSLSRFDFLADQVGGHLVNNDAFITSLTEKMITAELVNHIARAVASKASDPFDSIYIADLKPDIISAAALEEIDRVAGIIDVSTSIKFADDLD